MTNDNTEDARDKLETAYQDNRPFRVVSSVDDTGKPCYFVMKISNKQIAALQETGDEALQETNDDKVDLKDYGLIVEARYGKDYTPQERRYWQEEIDEDGPPSLGRGRGR